MAHSTLHPYPLPFPSEVQRTQISSYSSLANALGTDPAHANRHRRRPLLTKSDVVTKTQAIYSNRSPVSNPSYPYPPRNVLNPGTFHARTPLSVSSGRCPSNASIVWGDHGDQKDLPRYNRLPQPLFVEPDKLHGYQAGPEFPAIHFLRRDEKEPYSIWDLLTMDTMPDLVAGNLPILVQNPDRWIKIKLINEGAVVEPGQEHWAVTGVQEGDPAMWQNCVIASLQHRTGSIWQPEIYHPRR
ncbi:hypothetical protein J3R82DRAFT_11742 [Butyriboletus roseoflavus]|nr:hypothetical protein J3R82DRAFT_11742 [Butyriboletus roseoflavus]